MNELLRRRVAMVAFLPVVSFVTVVLVGCSPSGPTRGGARGGAAQTGSPATAAAPAPASTTTTGAPPPTSVTTTAALAPPFPVTTTTVALIDT
ncbi:MAG: hypothetical protein M3Y36_06120, partial [Actinomycetota bacterium]|nr:hypothetical protein [Actinomycetota bacterium]